MAPEEERQPGLTRERLVGAALELIGEDGLEGLSMRALADRLEVKAASLYWHVRDRRELMELLAESILETVRPPRGPSDWRSAVLDAAAALRERVDAQKDANRILLEVPESVTRSDTFRDLTGDLQSAGLQAAEAASVAMMVMTQVIASRAPAETPAVDRTGDVASIAIDSGSRGVVLRAGPPDMQALIRVPPGQSGAAPAVVRGERVVVRRLRGVGRGEIELNPRRAWKFKVQAPTWNTVLDVGGLDVREIHVDSGAAKVECFLPRPRGVIPIEVSGGVVGLTLHRPRGVAVAADISTGAVRIKLDDYAVKAAVTDSQWESEEGAAVATDRYQLRINGGAVQVNLDSEAKAIEPVKVEVPAAADGESAAALEILLDGVENRVRGRHSG